MTDGFNAVFVERRRKEMGDTMLLVPRTDMVETDDGFVLYCSMAGVRRTDIFLSLENGFLVLRAEARLAKLPGKVHALEFADAIFQNRIELPKNVDALRISASFSNGLLRVFLPYAEKRSERITINEG